jgi:hypothetical protein
MCRIHNSLEFYGLHHTTIRNAGVEPKYAEKTPDDPHVNLYEMSLVSVCIWNELGESPSLKPSRCRLLERGSIKSRQEHKKINSQRWTIQPTKNIGLHSISISGASRRGFCWPVYYKSTMTHPRAPRLPPFPRLGCKPTALWSLVSEMRTKVHTVLVMRIWIGVSFQCTSWQYSSRRL